MTHGIDGKNFFLDSYYSYIITRRVPLIAAGLQCTALLCRGRIQLCYHIPRVYTQSLATARDADFQTNQGFELKNDVLNTFFIIKNVVKNRKMI